MSRAAVRNQLPEASDGPYLLGVDLGGSSVKAVAVRPDGVLLGKGSATFDPDSELDWARQTRLLVDRLQARRGGRARLAGASAPGLAAQDGLSIRHMPGRLAGLEGMNWQKLLAAKWPVTVLNDAQAALLGEVWRGAAAGRRNVILLTLGTGVGGAAMVDGVLLRGHTGKAGHLGHVTLDARGRPDVVGMPGSLEDAVGNCTIKQRTGGRFATTHALIQAVRRGDAAARRVWLDSVHALAVAIASLTHVLDPELVVIGGGIARAGPDLFRPLRLGVRACEWQTGAQPVSIVRARLGEYAGAWGAARQAWVYHGLDDQPVNRP
jgi:glucokinase